MRKLALLMTLAFVAGTAFAAQAPAAKPAEKPAEKPAAAAEVKTHDVAVEIVSVDAVAKTVTIKGEKANATMPVDEKGLAAVKELKAGQKATLICLDDAKGMHKAVVGVNAEAKPPVPEKK
jgi:hypothetical protein